jgi:hypothetical protein
MDEIEKRLKEVESKVVWNSLAILILGVTSILLGLTLCCRAESPSPTHYFVDTTVAER